MEQTIEEYAKGLVERSSCKTQAEKDYYYAGALLGAEWKQKQMLADVCEYIEELFSTIEVNCTPMVVCGCFESAEQFAEDLRKHFEKTLGGTDMGIMA